MAKKVETIPNVKIVTDTKGLNALIASIGRTRAKLEAQINAAAIGCVFHAAEHGDATLATKMATKLIHTLGEKVTGIRSNAVIAWFEEYGALKWTKTETGNQFKVNKEAMAALRDRIEADREQVLLDLQEQSPWQLKPQAEYKGFIFMKELAALIKKAATKQDSEEEQDKAKHAKVPFNFDGLPQAAKLLAELNKSFGPKSNVESHTTH